MPTPCNHDVRIHVCSLAALEGTVAETGARHVVTVINPWSVPDTPPTVAPDDHLKLAFNDIVETVPGLVAPDGEHIDRKRAIDRYVRRLVQPDGEHIDRLLAFVARWNCAGPLVVHCLAGISRSTAAAYITLCALNQSVNETTIAERLRAASPFATPNMLMVQLADKMLARQGRMVEAIRAIGQGQPALSGKTFSICPVLT